VKESKNKYLFALIIKMIVVFIEEKAINFLESFLNELELEVLT